MKLRKLGIVSALSLLLVAVAAPAQQVIQRPTPLPAFGRSVAGTDDTTALVQNPANLAFMPGSEFRWSAVFLDESNQVPWQGHAFALGFPLLFVPFATGVRLDLIARPYSSTGGPCGQYS